MAARTLGPVQERSSRLVQCRWRLSRIFQMADAHYSNLHARPELERLLQGWQSALWAAEAGSAELRWDGPSTIDGQGVRYWCTRPIGSLAGRLAPSSPCSRTPKGSSARFVELASRLADSALARRTS
mmetsp:Transcript_183716/g.582786  ORF Transcript_183716/g.582786 Transcript_183716/m.582786 type:complete len:127 (-) Transcript_183716:282-662(-)